MATKTIFKRTELAKMNKSQLFDVFISHFDDEMSPLMWRGFTKKEILEMIFNGKDEVEVNWN